MRTIVDVPFRIHGVDLSITLLSKSGTVIRAAGMLLMSGLFYCIMIKMCHNDIVSSELDQVDS